MASCSFPSSFYKLPQGFASVHEPEENCASDLNACGKRIFECVETLDDNDPNEESVGFFNETDFFPLLDQVRNDPDPFVALTRQILSKEGYWTFFLELTNGASVECQLACDKWDSTTFGKSRPGEFRFIEVFEYDRISQITEEKALISIRISKDHKEGEWLWINKGKSLTGRQAKKIAERLSYAMRIEKCYLTDNAKILSSDGREIAIRVPLQVISGQGYYSPLFTLVKTETPILSYVSIDGTDESLYFDQDPEKHQSELLWLQSLRVCEIYKKILKGEPEEQKSFATLLEKCQSQPSLPKKRRSTLARLKNSDWTLQQLMSYLYKQKDTNDQNLADYEWAHFHLLDSSRIRTDSQIQRRYAWITEKLYFNMLMCAGFA